MILVKHSKMLLEDDLTIAALSYLVSGWLFEICPCPLAKLQVRGAERNFGSRDKNFVWALWSVVPQNHVMSKEKVIVSADVQISAQYLVMSKIRS